MTLDSYGETASGTRKSRSRPHAFYDHRVRPGFIRTAPADTVRTPASVEIAFEERRALDGLIERQERLQQIGHAMQRHGVRTVRLCLRRIRMRFHEETGDARRNRSACEHRHEFALTARARALPA